MNASKIAANGSIEAYGLPVPSSTSPPELMDTYKDYTQISAVWVGFVSAFVIIWILALTGTYLVSLLRIALVLIPTRCCPYFGRYSRLLFHWCACGITVSSKRQTANVDLPLKPNTVGKKYLPAGHCHQADCCQANRAEIVISASNHL